MYLQDINNPKDWVDFCLKYGIRASLQHGARNDRKVYKIIQANKGQFTVGVGPIIDGQGRRIVEKTENSIKAMFENLGPEYCLFSSDYPHNDKGEDLTREVEYLLSRDEQDKVFYRNAEDFFNVKLS